MSDRTALEQNIVEIWSQVFELEHIGINDDFFELGGHSLMAAQITARLKQTFEIDLSLRSVFELPTIAQLAQHIETILWATQKRQVSLNAAASNRKEGEL